MAYKPGDHYVICDQCSFRRLASECRMTWNNLFVCADTCWEEKHPLISPPKHRKDTQKVSVSRPEQDDVFITDKITGDDL